MSRHVVASVHEIPPGERKLVEVNGRAIVVFNIGGDFVALANRCPHEGGDLSRGHLTALVTSREPGVYERSREGEILRCPWHAWEFDLRTGRAICDPARVRARRYAVSVAHGGDLERIPKAAETFPVRVEDDYVVVEA
jgi:3-phenylpropionate/trans-cinnamate dioxygenase ferredoxin subunit